MAGLPGVGGPAPREAVVRHAAGLQWQRWDDETVVRVDATGATHLLAPAAAAVFGALVDAPGGVTVAGLADALFDPPDPADLDALLACLDGLGELGIVEYPAP